MSRIGRLARRLDPRAAGDASRNSWKFWLNLVLTVITVGLWGLVAWVWAIVDAAIRPSEWYEKYPNA